MRVAFRGAVLALLSMLAAPLAMPARADVVERVVAVVNDDAVFLSELRTKAAPYLARAMSLPARQRDAAIRDAVRPIAVAQMAGLLCLGALIGAVAVLAAPWFAAISASGREVLEAGAGMLAASAQLTSGWLPLVAGLAASLLLAPLALYFALARD